MLRDHPKQRPWWSWTLAAIAVLALAHLAGGPAHASTITVAPGAADINAGDGLCSLGEAVANANDDAATHADCAAGNGADTIELGASSDYEFTTGTASALVISDELIINGNAATVRQTGSANRRLITNLSGTILVLRHLTLQDGYTFENGGAIANSGDLTVTNVTFDGNSALMNGGAIFLSASSPGAALRVQNATFTGNAAIGTGSGGAIYASGSNFSFLVRDSTFDDNRALNGGAIYLSQSPATGLIAYSTFTGNRAYSNGGAIYLSSSLSNAMRLDHLTLTGNQADSAGGGLYLSVSAEIASSDLSLNTAGTSGGGIATSSALTLTQVSLRDNSAAVNGAGLNVILVSTSPRVIRYSEISGNSAGNNGGGMAVIEGGAVNLSHSTISGNDAANDGGGLFLERATAQLSFSTLMNNTAGSDGGGFHAMATFDAAEVLLRNTINLNNSTPATGFYDCSAFGAGVTVTTQGYNRYSGSALSGCAAYLTDPTDDFVSTPSVYVDLALIDNGGPTLTHEIFAVQGDPKSFHNQVPDGANGCQAGATLDQRGYTRAGGPGAGGSRCDIGAYEVSDFCATPSAPDVAIELAGSAVTLSWTQPAGNFSTEIWRAPDPYFDPNTPGGRLPYNTVDTTYEFDAAAGFQEPANPALNQFYVVRGVSGCGFVSSGVDRVGEFDFALTPGS